MMALQNYNGNFYKLVNDLIDGKADGKFNPSANSSYEINIDNFNGSVFQGLENLRDQFWEKLIEYMHNENSNNNLSHYGIRESDFAELENNKETVFEFINNHSDLVNNFLNNYINSGDSHWNESMKKLVDFFRKYIDPNSNNETDLIEYNENGKVIDSNGKISNGSVDGKFNFRIDDIINGDAGNYFETDNLKADISLDYKSAYNYDVEPNNGKINANKTWVRPWFNIDGDTYKIVRKGDEILRVLNSKKNLQFTRYKENEQDYIEEKLKTSNKKNEEVLSKYLRLIMPMYERIVEVEDLDRNFWVIAQVIGGISAYLFDDNSPIATMFSGILDEIVQLWENVAYLWAAMGLISQERYYIDIKTLFIPVYNSDLMPYIKFDNFAANGIENEVSLIETLEACWEKLQSLKSEYNKSNLVIIPEIRCKNYYRNYYAKVLYPGLIVYNRNFNSTQYYPFQTNKIKYNYIWPDFDGNGQIQLSERDTETGSELFSVDAQIWLTAYSIANAFPSEIEENQDYFYQEMIENIGSPFKNNSGALYKSIKDFNEKYLNYQIENYNQDDPLNEWDLTAKTNYFNIFKVKYYNKNGKEITTSIMRELMILMFNFVESYNNPTYENGGVQKWLEYIYNEKGWIQVPDFVAEETGLVYIDLTDEDDPISINSTAMKEDESDYYFLGGLYVDESKTKGIYKSLIRTIPTIEATIDNSYEITINNLELKFIDVCSELSGSNNNIISDLKLNDVISLNHNISKTIQLKNTLSKVTLASNQKEISEGYYQGELCSWTEEKGPTIDWSAELQQIKFNPQDYDPSVSSIDEFNSYFNYDAAKKRWNTLVRDMATSQLKDNGQGKLYYAHSNFIDSNNLSVFEATPFLSFAYKNEDGDLKIYSFLMNTSGALGLNYPFVSASYEKGEESTKLLYCIDQDNTNALYFDINNFYYSENGGEDVAVAKYDNDRITHNNEKSERIPLGNLRYGNMGVRYNNGIPELKNFIIYCLDRACLGISDILKSVPYYYKCSITTVGSDNNFGRITSSKESNDKTEEFYDWNENWKENGYTNIKEDSANKEGLRAISNFTSQLEEKLKENPETNTFLDIYKSMI